MKNYARIIDNVAVDVSKSPQTQFHPSIAEQFVEVPADVGHGWRLTEGVWAAPEPVEPSPSVAEISVSPVQFKLLFTPTERVAIRAARETDPVVDDFFDLLDDPRLDAVHLNAPSVRQMVEYLASQTLIAPERVDVIIAGQGA